jgi:hypothetical protein
MDSTVERVYELPRIEPTPELDARVLGLARAEFFASQRGARVGMAENWVHAVVVIAYAVYVAREVIHILLG